MPNVTKVPVSVKFTFTNICGASITAIMLWPVFGNQSLDYQLAILCESSRVGDNFVNVL
jgi:hypothetical protein